MKIGISLRIVESENYPEKRDALSHDWSSSLEKIDALPIFIPNNLSNVELFLDTIGIDGLILSGGDNLGENLARDHTEKQIINYGIKHNIPIFGVCRGMQAINSYFDGYTKKLDTNEHVGKFHTLTITNHFISTFLNEKITVNSYHYNIITSDTLGVGLTHFALSDDKTIEGFFHKKCSVIGVMWHPERDLNINNKILLRKVFFEEDFWKNLV